MADEEDAKQSSPWPILIVLGLVFLPGAIVAYFLWYLFRYLRNRPSVVGTVAAILGVIGLITLGVGVSGIAPLFSDLGNFTKYLPSLIPAWFGLSVVLGAPTGYGFVWLEARRLKRNPYLTQLEGSWRYKFDYRRTPWQLLERKKNIQKLKNGLLTTPKRSPMGLDEKTDEVVSRYATEAAKHTFITGQTGSGKSITMQSLMHSDIEMGKTVVVIDFKRSPKFAAMAAAFAEENGREFYHFVNGDPEDYDIPRSKGQCYYDPLRSGTPTSKADMVLGMREYDSAAAVYKTAMQQLLQVTFAMFKYGNREIARSIDWDHGGIAQLASAVSGNGMNELVEANSDDKRFPETFKYTYTPVGEGGLNGVPKAVPVNSPVAKNAIEIGEALKSKGALTQAYTELQGQMRTITASEYGRWMRTGNTPDDREIDLFKLTKQPGNVIMFSLNSDSEPEFAQYVGSMIFSDLTNISALRRNAQADNEVSIYVDEFQAVPPDAVTALLEKSRESKMAMTIAQQSFDQVVASAEKAGESYLNSILDTCGNFIAHAGSTEDSATRLSKLLGKHFVTVYSRTNENDSSFLSYNRSRSMDSRVAAREEERWVYPPSEFMKLSSPDPANGFKSSAVWVTKTTADPRYSKRGGGALARSVWMVPPVAVLSDYYSGAQKELIRRPKPVIEKAKNASVALEHDYSRQQAVADVNFDEFDPEEERQMFNFTPRESQDDDFSTYHEEDDEWTMTEEPAELLESEDEERKPETLSSMFSGSAPAPKPPLRKPVGPKSPQKKPELTDSDGLDSLFRTTPNSAPAPSKPLAQSPSPAQGSGPGLPRRSGLPTRPTGLPTAPKQKKTADSSLSDVGDMSLPEL